MARNIDATKLASELRITYQAVKKVLDGKSASFNAQNHARVAKYLEVSSDWLALGDGIPERGSQLMVKYWPFSVSPDIYEQISDEKKQELDTRVSSFIEGAFHETHQKTRKKKA